MTKVMYLTLFSRLFSHTVGLNIAISKMCTPYHYHKRSQTRHGNEKKSFSPSFYIITFFYDTIIISYHILLIPCACYLFVHCTYVLLSAKKQNMFSVCILLIHKQFFGAGSHRTLKQDGILLCYMPPNLCTYIFRGKHIKCIKFVI